ncbi:MAG: class I SAM-dependent methyltransferase [candidate division WOR-3 bacterium]|nr:class I SAM-dependent methyltransferase [candidate division WOR-3 bacterium]
MKSEGFSPPFSEIAPYYDRLMSFINYQSWVNYIERIIMIHRIEEKLILDIACGTGVCLELWLKKGYNVIGLDGSEAMLEISRNRFDYELFKQGRVKLLKSDMRNFSLDEPVPVITCLYDSLNYLLTPDELYSCFKSVYENLKSNGLFIFDMNTIHALQVEWGNQTFERRDGPIHSIWNNVFDPHTRISTLRLTLNIYENGQIKTIKELHQEKAYSLDEIRKLADDAGFKISLYRHLTFKPACEMDTRIMGVAIKL